MTPLMNHTHDSLLQGLTKPADLVQYAVDNELNSIAITDFTLGGSYEFWTAANSAGIKPIIGCDFELGHSKKILLIAQNLDGWYSLIQATSRSNFADVYDKQNERAQLDFDHLRLYNKGLIAITGYLGSELASIILKHPTHALYKSEEQIKKSAEPNWYKECLSIVRAYQDTFGETYLAVEDGVGVYSVLREAMRYISKKTGIPCVALTNSFYSKKEDSVDHRILLATKLKCGLSEIDSVMARSEDVYTHMTATRDGYHLRGWKSFTAGEIENARRISEACEHYNIRRQPMTPEFDCPDGLSELEYLRKLCENGWKKRCDGFVQDHKIYRDRLNEEIRVFEKAGLAGYFLIVQDYTNWCRQQGWLLGAGRGSVGGSLAAYLLGIHGVDPIKYGLIFARFYNEGRNTADNISYPDIDMDFPVEKRPLVFEYLKEKYGHDNVAQICTFGKMKGRGALKAVFTAHKVCSFMELNDITAPVPDEGLISDQISKDQPSIIRWALENRAEELKEWVHLKDDGSCGGQYGKLFEQSIRIEGTKKSTGRHPGGVVLGKKELFKSFPMIKDKNADELITGVDMKGVEFLGGVKFDILGVSCLSKLETVKELLLKYE